MNMMHNQTVHEDTPVADLINQNPRILMLLDHLGACYTEGHRSVGALCASIGMSFPVFRWFAGLYSGRNHDWNPGIEPAEIPAIVRFLQSSHQYYRNEKYPEIRKLITKLCEVNSSPEVKLTEKFFDDYFSEVIQHLEYEENYVFPYIHKLLEGPEAEHGNRRKRYSAAEYHNHHSDIESKLNDLKNLLLRYLPSGNDRTERRQLLISLLELEFDLFIHSRVEENVLIPIVKRLELERAGI